MTTGQTTAPMDLRDPDIRLMFRVRDDDSAAFAELVGRFQHRLVAVLHHLVGSPDEAEDLAQEVFLWVYRARKGYAPRAKFSTWLFAIANNLALNSLRDRQRRATLPPGARDSGPPGPRPGDAPAHRLQRQELADVVRGALGGLSRRQRVAIVLNKFEDMSYADIADVMALTPKAVKSLLCRARARLRDAPRGYVYMDAGPPAREPVAGER
jgi:RNA polymerase sigma-70 factor (ECF subfamily)